MSKLFREWARRRIMAKVTASGRLSDSSSGSSGSSGSSSHKNSTQHTLEMASRQLAQLVQPPPKRKAVVAAFPPPGLFRPHGRGEDFVRGWLQGAKEFSPPEVWEDEGYRLEGSEEEYDDAEFMRPIVVQKTGP